MAQNTRAARRKAEAARLELITTYEEWLLSIFHNSVTFSNLPDDLPKRYLVKTLLTKGMIAYDHETDLWLPANPVDILSAYGLPVEYELYGYDGLLIRRNWYEVDILRLNDLEAPLAPYIAQQAERLADFDLAIAQNLEACKTMTYVEFQDEGQLLSVVNASEARRVGASVAYVRKQNMQGVETKCMSSGATFLVREMQDARKNILNETLARLGVSTANTDKRETVQAAEVVGAQGMALDALFTFVNTFNHDAAVAGLAIRANANTSVVDLLNIDARTGKVEGDEGADNSDLGAQGGKLSDKYTDMEV